MDYMGILKAVLALAGIGLLFGVILSIASKCFAVEKDERFDEIVAMLPGANCGGCGYAGCSALAEAILAGNASPTLCVACNPDTPAQIAEKLGITITQNIRMTALVRCSGGEHSQNRYIYSGLHDCIAAAKLAGGPKECPYGCLGLGSCVAACQFGALSIKNGVAVVDHEKCTGCLRCVNTCPRHVIVAVPYTADVSVLCSSQQRGADLRKICEIGCLGCKICERTCTHDAIKVINNLAVIDYEKCTGCGECADKCPRHLIKDTKIGEAMEAAMAAEAETENESDDLSVDNLK